VINTATAVEVVVPIYIHPINTQQTSGEYLKLFYSDGKEKIINAAIEFKNLVATYFISGVLTGSLK
jgi:hypothetical protein